MTAYKGRALSDQRTTRRATSATSVEVDWEHEDEEGGCREFVVTASVTLGSPGSRRGDPGDWEPDDPGELDVEGVVEVLASPKGQKQKTIPMDVDAFRDLLGAAEWARLEDALGEAAVAENEPDWDAMADAARDDMGRDE